MMELTRKEKITKTKEMATNIIDTTKMTPGELKEELKDLLRRKAYG